MYPMIHRLLQNLLPDVQRALVPFLANEMEINVFEKTTYGDILRKMRGASGGSAKTIRTLAKIGNFFLNKFTGSSIQQRIMKKIKENLSKFM